MSANWQQYIKHNSLWELVSLVWGKVFSKDKKLGKMNIPKQILENAT